MGNARRLFEKIAPIELLILQGFIFLACPFLLNAQISIGCSNGLTSFEQYQPIIYPFLARRAGVTANQTGELSIKSGGDFTYRLDEPRFSLSKEIQEAIVGAISGWKFQNDAGQTISLKLSIFFELPETVRFADDKVKNQITFSKSDITIKVIASKIIPELR
jgi:hypothetical protein